MSTPNKPRIAVLDDYQQVAFQMADWSVVKRVASVSVFGDVMSDADGLIARLAPYDVICVMRERTPLPRSTLQRLPRLKMIVSTGARNASIDLEAAAEAGVEVKHTRGSLAAPIELTWGLILSAARSIPAEVASVRAGGWQRSVGSELSGMTLGVLGFGRIGQQVAAIAHAFGMNVVTWSSRSHGNRPAQAGARVVDRREFFGCSDFLSIHLPLVDETHELVGRSELDAMKATAWLINTSRGPIVAEPALLAALTSGSIAGAAVDVFASEPLAANHPFRSLPNVIATPHIGYVSREQYAVFFGDTVAHVTDWLTRNGWAP